MGNHRTRLKSWWSCRKPTFKISYATLFLLSQKTLSTHLALKYGKIGLECKEFPEYISVKKVLIQHGVLSKDTFQFMTDVTLFCRTTGLRPEVFIPILGSYLKFAPGMSIRSYQDLQKRISQVLQSLEFMNEEEKVLMENYKLLTKASVNKNSK